MKLFAELTNGIGPTVICTAKLVTHVLPLDEADTGIQAALAGEALKVVFTP